ncbi:hypothetical protein [Streptomyces zaomyceticus]|uniref:hypothetical protein n=1 Tax=Streptomyces zaomyceticus TaxID=68286 RepID=UPI0037A7A34D
MDRVADLDEVALGDVGERGLHLLRHRPAELRGEPAALEVRLQRLARVLVLPVAAQREVEGGQGAADDGEGGPEGEDEVLEVAARRAGEVHPDGQEPAARRPGRLAPLGGALLGAGERLFELPGQGGLADAADPVEHEHVVARRLQVLHVEARRGDTDQVLGERGRNQLPLRFAVGERLCCGHTPVVAAEQRPQIPSRHGRPQSVITVVQPMPLNSLLEKGIERWGSAKLGRC